MNLNPITLYFTTLKTHAQIPHKFYIRQGDHETMRVELKFLFRIYDLFPKKEKYFPPLTTNALISTHQISTHSVQGVPKKWHARNCLIVHKPLLRLISIQCNLASAQKFAIAFFWNLCCHAERISLDMADCTHFKRKRSQNSARSLNCTEWKSAFKNGLLHTRELVQQLENENDWKLTPSGNNSILALYCAFRPDNRIFVCWQRSNYL